MRLTIALAAIAALAVTMVPAADPGSGGTTAPTDDAIINACGARLVKVFDQFGLPTDVIPNRGNAADGSMDEATIIYGSFGFNIRDKFVRDCFFWSSSGAATPWTGTIKGIKLGDSRQDVEKVLGTQHRVLPPPDSQSPQGDLGYDLKDLDAVFWVNFDQNDKVERINVALQD
jgi:hypothetical protein